MTVPSSPDAASLEGRLRFDAENHAYWLDGRQLISVTQVLQAAGFVDTRWFNDRAATRGTFVHEATALLDQGSLDMDSLDPEIEPYVRGYQKFLQDAQPVWSRVEWLVCDDLSDVAGTVDRIGTIKVKGVTQNVIIDLKTGRGGAAPWHPIQLAGYQHLVTYYLSRQGHTEEAAKIRRYGLYLRDGNYTLTPYVDPQDVGVFLSALTVAHWLKKGRS